jgi:hypothetical protein
MGNRRFTSVRRVDLSFVGPEWADAFVQLTTPTYGELTEFNRKTNEMKASDDVAYAEAVAEIIKANFVAGRAYDMVSKQLVDLTDKDIMDLPISAVNEIRQNITGAKALNPNLSPASMQSSEAETPTTTQKQNTGQSAESTESASA